MAAVLPSLVLLGATLIPTVAFLVIALVSLKGTRPADRPAILRALAALTALHRRNGRHSSGR
jgi:hypothetical protein